MSTGGSRRVLVTRPLGSWPGLSARFTGSGIDVEFAATTAQVDPVDPAPGDRALQALEGYRWLLLTSGQGVKALALKLSIRGRRGLPPGVRVGAVGAATARALEGLGFRVAFVADEPRGDGLAHGIAPHVAAGDRILIVRPEGGPGLLAAALRATGAHVDEAPLYRTVAARGAAALAEAAIAQHWEAIVFTAPSSLEMWLSAAEGRREALYEALSKTARIAIGPTTAATLVANGLAPTAVAGMPTEAAVGDAIAAVLTVPAVDRVDPRPPS
jgi:uroporphyrinogen-III synthase